MIEFGLSDEYLSGYSARLSNKPFDEDQDDDWRMGWLNAEQASTHRMSENTVTLKDIEKKVTEANQAADKLLQVTKELRKTVSRTGGQMITKHEPNKVTTTLKVDVTGEFYDDEATEETLRYWVEQTLEDAGFDVDVSLVEQQQAG